MADSIDIGTTLSFGKYKGQLVDRYPIGTVPFSYLLWLRDNSKISLSKRLLKALYSQEKRMRNQKKDYFEKDNISSIDWEPNVCSLCGQKHIMACNYY